MIHTTWTRRHSAFASLVESTYQVKLSEGTNRAHSNFCMCVLQNYPKTKESIFVAFCGKDTLALCRKPSNFVLVDTGLQ